MVTGGPSSIGGQLEDKPAPDIAVVDDLGRCDLENLQGSNTNLTFSNLGRYITVSVLASLDNYQCRYRISRADLWKKYKMITLMQDGNQAHILRIVSAYGPRDNETHATISLAHKSERADPFGIWGNRQLERELSSAHIVVDSILTSQAVSDCTQINDVNFFMPRPNDMDLNVDERHQKLSTLWNVYVQRGNSSI